VLHNRRRRKYAAVHAHHELAQLETLSGSTHKVCDAIVVLSSACVQSGIDTQTTQSLSLLPLGHQTVPAQQGSRRKREAVAEGVTAKQEQCKRPVR